ncbi:MAG: OmpA family protein [Deltaproteobacteria bacterium]|nr:OmpA family protein [Deltaproteobacteria bacterium]
MAEEQTEIRDDGGGDCDCPPCEAGAPAWMATFADLATLLMTFFVLLLSFANMDIVKFKMMSGSVKDAFGSRLENQGEFDEKSESAVTVQLSEEEDRTIDMMQMGERIRRTVEEQELEDKTEVRVDDEGVTLTVAGTFMFDGGSAELKAEFKNFLTEIAQIIEEHDYPLAIEGHSDNIPIKSDLYPSNWELSSCRATAVLRHLIETYKVPPQRLIAVGYSDTRPLVPNDSPENRAKNRRVEFHFKKKADG